VIEIGMSHPGEIAPLAKLTRPHVAMITTVAPAHMEAFDNIEGIAGEKATILEGLEPGGVAVLNADLDTSPILIAKAKDVGARVVRFGQSAGEFRLERVTLSDETTICEANITGAPLVFKIPTAGRHFAMNGLGTLAVVDALGADLAIAASDIAAWLPPRGRGSRERLVLDDGVEAEIALIDDAFNANPTSMAVSLEVLAAATPVDPRAGRRIAILGDMLELGEGEAGEHAALAHLPWIERVQAVHCVGPLMQTLFDALSLDKRGRWVETAPEMVALVRGLIKPGDIVLVKGSKGSKVSLVVDAIRKMGHRAPNLQRDE